MSAKRSFYADEELRVPQPGVNTVISEELEKQESLPLSSTNKLVNGNLITTNPVLEKYANKAREYFLEKTEFITAKYEFSKDMAEMHSAMVAEQYNKLIVEPLLPNGLYVLTATLLGAITVNRRSLPLRFITPIIFGTTASAYLFPKSFNNVTNGIEHLEGKHAPELKKFQDNASKGFDELKISVIQFEKDLNYSFTDCVRCVRESLQSLFK